MQPKVRKVFGSPKFVRRTDNRGQFVDNTTHVGVEVETENCGVSMEVLDDQLGFWSVTEDGSLKSGYPYEFIFAQPLAGEDISSATKELELVLSSTNAKFPHNTGVHVHVDTGDMTLEELRFFVYLSITLESALVEFSGGKRNNSFCIPWGHSSIAVVSRLGNMIDGNPGASIDSSAKYATVNLASLYNLGTLEFRTMVGTCEATIINEWINVILMIKKFVMDNKDLDPRDLVDYTSTTKTLVEFLGMIFPRSIWTRMLHKSLHDDMQRSAFVARLGLFPKSNYELKSWIQNQYYEEHTHFKQWKMMEPPVSALSIDEDDNDEIYMELG